MPGGPLRIQASCDLSAVAHSAARTAVIQDQSNTRDVLHNDHEAVKPAGPKGPDNPTQGSSITAHLLFTMTSKQAAPGHTGHCKTVSSFRMFNRPAGGARRDRTDDLKLAKLPLSQLSYGPGPGRPDRQQADGGPE